MRLSKNFLVIKILMQTSKHTQWKTLHQPKTRFEGSKYCSSNTSYGNCLNEIQSTVLHFIMQTYKNLQVVFPDFQPILAKHLYHNTK